MEIKIIIFSIIIAFLGAVGAVLIKKGAAKLNLKKVKEQKKPVIMLIIGIFIYGITTIFITFMLKTYELSLLFPIITSLHYVMTAWLSIIILKEKITKKTKTSIILIIIGIIIITL